MEATQRLEFAKTRVSMEQFCVRYLPIGLRTESQEGKHYPHHDSDGPSGRRVDIESATDLQNALLNSIYR